MGKSCHSRRQRADRVAKVSKSCHSIRHRVGRTTEEGRKGPLLPEDVGTAASHIILPHPSVPSFATGTSGCSSSSCKVLR